MLTRIADWPVNNDVALHDEAPLEIQTAAPNSLHTAVSCIIALLHREKRAVDAWPPECQKGRYQPVQERKAITEDGPSHLVEAGTLP